MEHGFEGMEFVEVEVHKLVSLHMMRLEHPSHLSWDGEGQKPLLEWVFGYNIQLGTTLERVGHTWVVPPPDKGKYEHYNAVFHTSAPKEEEGMIVGS